MLQPTISQTIKLKKKIENAIKMLTTLQQNKTNLYVFTLIIYQLEIFLITFLEIWKWFNWYLSRLSLIIIYFLFLEKYSEISLIKKKVLQLFQKFIFNKCNGRRKRRWQSCKMKYIFFRNFRCPWDSTFHSYDFPLTGFRLVCPAYLHFPCGTNSTVLQYDMCHVSELIASGSNIWWNLAAQI